MNTRLEVPEGKDVLEIQVAGHTYVRVLDEEGREAFRFQSPGKHVTAVVRPGRYTAETDGEFAKLELVSVEPRLRAARAFDARKPPQPRDQ